MNTFKRKWTGIWWWVFQEPDFSKTCSCTDGIWRSLCFGFLILSYWNWLWMSNCSFALSPNIFHGNQLGWPWRGYFIKRGMIPQVRLVEIKRPENRFYYFHDDISSLDLWLKNLLMMKRNLRELRVFLTIPP